jgi:hypothetical protein
MGQNISSVPPTTPLSSSKILLIGKGLYGLTMPKLDPNSPPYRYKVKLDVHLKDRQLNDIPHELSNPQFIFPVSRGSQNFENVHFHLPNLDIMQGLSVIATLIREEEQRQPSQRPLVQTIKQKEAPTQQGYLNTMLSYVGVNNAFDDDLGMGFLNLDLLKETDFYHNVTLPLYGKSKEIVAKIDLAVVRPGLVTELFELRTAIIDLKLTNKSLHSHTIDAELGDVSKIENVREAKGKLEAIARSWINAHTEERIEVVSVDTTHIYSKAGEMLSTTVWFRFCDKFIEEAHKLNEIRLKEIEERKKKDEEERKKREEERKEEADRKKKEAEERGDKKKVTFEDEQPKTEVLEIQE